MGPRRADDAWAVPRRGQGLRTGRRAESLSAAVLWGLLDWEEDRLPEVTVPIGPRAQDPRDHRPSHPGAVQDRPLRRASPLSTPARALIDISSVLPFDPLRRAVREAMALKRVTVKELIGGSADPRRDHRRRLRPHPQRVRGCGPRPHRQGRLHRARRRQAHHRRRQAHEARLPLARTAPGDRGRRRPVARPSARPRGRRGAPGAARSGGERVIRVSWNRRRSARSRRSRG